MEVLVGVLDGSGVSVAVWVEVGRGVGVVEGIWLAAGSVGAGRVVSTGESDWQPDRIKAAIHPKLRKLRGYHLEMATLGNRRSLNIPPL